LTVLAISLNLFASSKNEKHTMRIETYDLKAKKSLMTFEFISKGSKGAIKKRIQYQKIDDEGDVYNLAFGDVDLVTNDVNDVTISNNDDTTKVLATVASTVPLFISKYPNAIIYAKGSTPTRTRLYQIGIAKNLDIINENFTIYGLLGENNFEKFQKNKHYSAFVIIKKG
jgi:hypothetical protein